MGRGARAKGWPTSPIQRDGATHATASAWLTARCFSRSTLLPAMAMAMFGPTMLRNSLTQCLTRVKESLWVMS